MSSIVFSAKRNERKHIFNPEDFINRRPSKYKRFLAHSLSICFKRPAIWFSVILCFYEYYYKSLIDYKITFISIFFTILSSFLIDFIRYFRKNDFIEKINQRKARVFEDSMWKDVNWSDLQPGDIIKMKNGEYAPCDLIVLGTDDNIQCSVETYMIDGSPQWQPRGPPNFIFQFNENTILESNITLYDMKIQQLEEQFTPKSVLNTKYNFSAKLDCRGKKYEINNNNFVERYSIFYHKGDILCGVVFTGEDCQTNFNHLIQSNVTGIEKSINKQNMLQIYFLIFFSLFSTVISDIVNGSKYAIETDFNKTQYYIDLFSFYFILLSPIVSLQLFSLIDLVLILNSQVMRHNYDRSTVINLEALNETSNVNCLMTSKSMLLERKPCLKRILLNNCVYGSDITSKLLSRNIENDILQNKPLQKEFHDPNLIPSNENQLFFLHIALCHSASIVGNRNKFNYISRFPDDEQLLKLAANNGFMLLGRTQDESKILINNKIFVFKTRRIFHSCIRHPRISIIIEDENGTLILLTRGVFKVMASTVPELSNYDQFYETFHSSGLHVEVCSYKYLTQKELLNLEQQMDSLGETQSEFEFSFIESFESNSNFVAMLGFEDVPRDGALLFLSRARKAFNQIIVCSQSKGTSLIITEISLGIIEDEPVVGTIKGGILEDVDISISYLMEMQQYDIIIVTGNAIEFLYQSEYKYQIANLLKQTKSIILQRAGPLQVAAFIEFMQIYTKQNILAVGHTLNDSAFMHQANVSMTISNGELKISPTFSDIVVNDFEQLAEIVFFMCGTIKERADNLVNLTIIRDSIMAMIYFMFSAMNPSIKSLIFPTWSHISIILVFTVIPMMVRSVLNQEKSRDEVINDLENIKKENKKVDAFLKFIKFEFIAFVLSILYFISSNFLFGQFEFHKYPPALIFVTISVFTLSFNSAVLATCKVTFPMLALSLLNFIGFIAICIFFSENRTRSYYYGGCNQMFYSKNNFFFIIIWVLGVFLIQKIIYWTRHQSKLFPRKDTFVPTEERLLL